MKMINLGSKKLASFYVACELYKQMHQEPNSKLGLATGGTMTDLYYYLVDLLEKNKLDVSHVETFNLDEYVGLKPSHPQSYHYYMNDVLFKQYPHFKKDNTHIPNGYTEQLEDEAERYNQLLNDKGPVDIQILGIGENGHIGFNEPGTDLHSETHIVDLTESTIRANSRYFDHKEDVPKQAVSMGLASILKAKRIILLAFGEKKKDAMSKLLLDQQVTRNVPATILHAHPNVEVYVDDEAAPDHL
ncbi:glucosamine-6-phosphate deaminase [Staphylococcus saccharolyticus]|uniref:glucosamine-6-phosphate deaminase n=1 Tax=Staphylococcus saccharolyticus TaxID=33028 RepID=UPI00102DF6E6|nr:glucosamine-6-phosphate deaminase [Staphylococcus saccharolyticus]MBL7572601.1 glucosamine-6-phosphate deaminase [Staphylococcus saccharolyticus]MBL7584820.1 glucosamine-6-phosphate deaminase [Staphylococcus saccharolyticus]MBL7638215.1 glucosamine-6-phosphate deaminase [Staphylococcus saccharolyticus]QRJ68269.1 glucosamine-6-phosphate deaminase [Staphylococcus saccharolyticus]TAA93142.1 glucosamine-6-phosphate deaminase [Staphylococcus saccharolyticus]